MRTIRAKLLLGLLLGISVAIVVALVSTYWIARAQAGHAFDYHLQQIAETAPDHIHIGLSPRVLDAEEFILLQIWDKDGSVLYTSRSNTLLPMQSIDGFQNVTALGKKWRVFVQIRDDKIIQVSQLMAEREELILQLAVAAVLPLFGLIPLLAILVSVVVARNLKPLEHLTDAIAQRNQDALQPIILPHTSLEVEKVTQAMNGLMLRLDQSLHAQKEFIADAAHELRTPLAALHLQLQLAERATTEEARVQAFEKLHVRLDRAEHLVAQLLSLARQDVAKGQASLEIIDLCELAKKAVADLSLLAESKNIDLGVVCSTEKLFANGVRSDLEILLNCLIDNAVRYTPSGGRVDVVLDINDGRPMLAIVDNGPGIPSEERERVFDRFYRGADATQTGSGLGLSIVRKIAAAHGAVIGIEDNENKIGIRVVITFPALDAKTLGLYRQKNFDSRIS